MKNIININLDKLFPHPNNLRASLGDLTELANSIKAQGILQNLTVVKKTGKKEAYTIIIGHHRAAAAKLAGLKEAPCAIVEMNANDQMSAIFIENLHRNDLTMPEQANGIQLMMESGETIKSIAEKTGLTEKKVKKRAFVATLDKEEAASAWERGATLEDYMKLQQIENEENRNKVMAKIGTHDFNHSLKNAISEELRDRVAPKIISFVEKFAEQTEKASYELNGYNYYDHFEYETFDENDKENKGAIPESFSPGEYLYYVGLSKLTILKRYNESPAKKKMSELSPEEQEERRAVRRRYKEIKELSETAYNLRADFVRSFSRKTFTTAELKAISELAFAAVCLGERLEFRLFAKAENLSEIDTDTHVTLNFAAKRKAVTAPPTKMLLAALYSTFRDNETNRYFLASGETMAENIGKYKKNEKLDAIYDCLCSLGYMMSEDEKALRDGRHELFVPTESSEPEKQAA